MRFYTEISRGARMPPWKGLVKGKTRMSLLLPGPKASSTTHGKKLINAYRPGIKTHWLQYFVAIAHHGHLGHAAQEIGVTVQAMHHALGQLEAFSGSELFQREGGHILLTPTGEHLFHSATELLQTLQEITHKPIVQRHLTIAYVDTGYTALWATLLQQLRQVYPHHYLRAVGVPTQAVLEEQLCEGQVDLALLPHCPTAPELVYQVSPSCPYVIVATTPEQQHWEDLTYVALSHPDAAPWNQELYPRRIQLQVGQFEALLQVLYAGRHAAHVPKELIAGDLAAGRLHRVAEAPEAHCWQMYLCWHEADARAIPWATIGQRLWSMPNA